MSFFDTVKSTLGTAFETISGVAQNAIEARRTNAKLSRLRSIMKSESELMNRAYIALGKDYYAQIKKGEKPASEREEKLVQLIDNCKARIAKARDCYREIVESQNEFIYNTPADNADETEAEEVVDITVACSNENEYESSPFDSTTDEAEAESDGESPDGEPF